MSKLNIKQPTILTHEGGKAKHINAEQQLRRSIMSCLLWERQFYEDGVDIAERVRQAIPLVDAGKVADMAIEARERMKLRHIPLLMVREMARLSTHKALVADTLARVIQRPDELTEFIAIYWQDGKQSLSAQVKKGLASAFTKFDAYQLAKYNRKDAIKLRDVLFLCHAKPKNKEQEALWRHLVDDTLPVPETWEVGLSSGEDKKQVWERLLKENKLGALALLRNLRNMKDVAVEESLVLKALEAMNVGRILPFRFIASARYAPQWEDAIEKAMMRALSNIETLSGKTILMVDVSGSMEQELSSRSEMTRMDAACGVAMLAREICNAQIITFSGTAVMVPARHGFALRDAVISSQEHDGTYLGNAVQVVQEGNEYDRLIIITDEQAHDNIPNPKGKGYVINVASYQNGVGYGAWTHIDGWSESVLNYIKEIEANEVANE